MTALQEKEIRTG